MGGCLLALVNLASQDVKVVSHPKVVSPVRVNKERVVRNHGMVLVGIMGIVYRVYQSWIGYGLRQMMLVMIIWGEVYVVV